ncbi:MAG: hypothetical protein JW958_13855 [Candidatus Eisenbacteria bacterium]|nr:hypothetical protein [Candidatus Eisenbacteria bacterium]
MIVVITLLIVAFLALVFELLTIDLVGIGILLVLALTGILSPGDAVAGFSSRAVITVGSLFIVGEGILRTGAVGFVARRIIDLSRGNATAILLLTILSVGAVSAFLNNTPVVIVFIPILLGIASEQHIFPSKLLMPLSYASMLGGSCTLIGTSTTILVSTLAETHGQPPIAMFEMTKAGILLFLIGGIYLLTLGRHLLPEHHTLTTTRDPVREFVTEIEILWGSQAAGKPVLDVFGKTGPTVLALVRDEEMIWPPFKDRTVQEGDLFILQGNINDIAEVESREGVRILPGLLDGRARFEPKSMSFVELVVPPDSGFVSRRVRDLGLRRRADLVPIAIMRGGRHIRKRVSEMVIRPGDVILAFGGKESVEEISDTRDFLLMEGIHELFINRKRAPIAISILLVVMLALSTGVVPMEVASLGGAFLMLLTGCLTPGQAYRSVNWPILILIAGTLALGQALEITGTAARIAEPLVRVGEMYGARAALSTLFLVTSLVTALLSNNATAVFFVPIAISMAASLGVDARPFLITVAYAASASFATPLGYQTNLLVYGPGGYSFRDFLRVGGPLTILIWAIGSLLIPLFWPF